MYVELADQDHGSEVGIPTDGAALPSWMIQSVQLPEAGSELLRLWVDWDLEERGCNLGRKEVVRFQYEGL